MPVAKTSRLAEVKALLDVMKERGITSLKVGDIELTLAAGQSVPPLDELPPVRVRSAEEREQADRLTRRNLTLASGSRIVSRAGE